MDDNSASSLVCQYCRKKFAYHSFLKRHIINVHGKKRIIPCPSCTFVAFREKSLLSHWRIEHCPGRSRPIQCKICNKCFDTEEVAVSHATSVHCDGKYCRHCSILYLDLFGLKKCLHCPLIYTVEADLLQHIGLHHRLGKDYNPAGFLFHCYACNLEFGNNGSLLSHLQINHNFSTGAAICIHCGLVYKSRAVQQQHQSDCLPRPIAQYVKSMRCKTCRYCPASFSTAEALTSHMKEHDFICAQCGKVFDNLTRLQAHQDVHNPFPVVNCGHCRAKFSTKAEMNAHVEREHGHELDHLCDVCGKRFRAATLLQVHMLIHDKKKACEHCGKRFAKKSDLDRHLRVHTQDKPYRCALCDKRFSQSSTLKAHMRSKKHNALSADSSGAK